MLVPIVFIVALILTLATAMLENGLAGAKVALNTRVARYSDVAMSDGVASFTGGLAAFVRDHGSSGPWPGGTSHSYPKSMCDSAVPINQCPFTYTIDGTITAGFSADSALGSRDDAGSVQTSVIGEQRISATVSVTLTNGTGTLLGTRTRLLTYRVFEAAPYAIASGSRDTTTVNGSRATAQGDSAGAATVADATAVTAAGTIHDTRIHVQLNCSTIIPNIKPFQNDQQAAGNHGLPWGNQPGGAYETPCHQPASAADAFADRSWKNGNTNASGWTQ